MPPRSTSYSYTLVIALALTVNVGHITFPEVSYTSPCICIPPTVDFPLCGRSSCLRVSLLQSLPELLPCLSPIPSLLLTRGI